MRQRIGPKKVQQYRDATGLPVVSATARGGSGHYVSLHLEGGAVVYYHPKTGDVKPSAIGWKLPPTTTPETT